MSSDDGRDERRQRRRVVRPVGVHLDDDPGAAGERDAEPVEVRPAEALLGRAVADADPRRRPPARPSASVAGPVGRAVVDDEQRRAGQRRRGSRPRSPAGSRPRRRSAGRPTRRAEAPVADRASGGAASASVGHRPASVRPVTLAGRAATSGPSVTGCSSRRAVSRPRSVRIAVTGTARGDGERRPGSGRSPSDVAVFVDGACRPG